MNESSLSCVLQRGRTVCGMGEQCGGRQNVNVGFSRFYFFGLIVSLVDPQNLLKRECKCVAVDCGWKFLELHS